MPEIPYIQWIKNSDMKYNAARDLDLQNLGSATKSTACKQGDEGIHHFFMCTKGTALFRKLIKKVVYSDCSSHAISLCMIFIYSAGVLDP
jgi:hypothetical protein